jgi:hypothetical protein
MKIIQQDSNFSYDIVEHSRSVKLVDAVTNRAYYFRESYEAIWFLIELVRNTSIDHISDGDLKEIASRARVSVDEVTKSRMAAFKKEKIDHTYYDQVFLKLLSQYRSGADTFTLSNKMNFSVQYEMVHLIRQSASRRLSALHTVYV